MFLRSEAKRRVAQPLDHLEAKRHRTSDQKSAHCLGDLKLGPGSLVTLLLLWLLWCNPVLSPPSRNARVCLPAWKPHSNPPDGDQVWPVVLLFRNLEMADRCQDVLLCSTFSPCLGNSTHPNSTGAFALRSPWTSSKLMGLDERAVAQQAFLAATQLKDSCRSRCVLVL